MYIENYIQESIKTKQRLLADKEIIKTIEDASKAIVQAYKNGNKVLTAGNGGSANDAQHIAGELVAKFYLERRGLSAYALTTNSAIMTAIGNDCGYEHLFERQVQANGVKGDVLIALSTSGNSENIILALKEAKKNGLITIGLTGQNPSKMDVLCDYLIKIPSDDTPKVQESHVMVGHIICACVEKELFGEKL